MNLSILGASICTYEGYSNNTKYNSTIGNNKVFFNDEILGSVDNTFWMKLVNNNNMKLIVNNSYSGARVLDRREDACGYLDRPRELDNREDWPELIIVHMGLNDHRDETPVGYYNFSTFKKIEESVNMNNRYYPKSFIEGYIEMIYKIKYRYPDAIILIWSIPDRGFNTELLKEYNAAIKDVCIYYDCIYLELPDEMSGDNYINYTVGDNIHPNIEGMDIMYNVIVNALSK